jgi:hypothetical protein
VLIHPWQLDKYIFGTLKVNTFFQTAVFLIGVWGANVKTG